MKALIIASIIALTAFAVFARDTPAGHKVLRELGLEQAPVQPVNVVILGDPTSIKSPAPVFAQVHDTASALSHRPGSKVAVHLLGQATGVIPLLVDRTVTQSTAFGAEQRERDAANFGRDVAERARAAWQQKVAQLPALAQSLVAEGITALAAFGLPRDTILIVMSDGLQVGSTVRPPAQSVPVAKAAGGKGIPVDRRAVVADDPSDALDLECSSVTPELLDRARKYMDTRRLLLPKSLAGVHVFFAFAAPHQIERPGCTYNAGGLRLFWTTLLMERAGAASVSFFSDVAPLDLAN